MAGARYLESLMQKSSLRVSPECWGRRLRGSSAQASPLTLMCSEHQPRSTECVSENPGSLWLAALSPCLPQSEPSWSGDQGPSSVQPVVLVINSVELTHACALCSSHEMCIPWGPPSCVLCWGEAGLSTWALSWAVAPTCLRQHLAV